jgi:hypothetical protein
MNYPTIEHVKRDAGPFNMEQRHYHDQYEAEREPVPIIAYLILNSSCDFKI